MSDQHPPAPDVEPIPGQVSHRAPKRARRWPLWKKLLITLAVLALATVIGVAAVFLFTKHQIDSSMTRIDVTSQSGGLEKAQSSEPVNFLIMGSDSRDSGGDPKDWQYGAGRSDVTMFVQISADRSTVSMMSIPRDSWVDIPGHGQAKINAAYAFGGPSLAIQTVQDLTGLPINHFMVVDFTSFAELTDELGGVDVSTDAGVQHLTGEEALTFVRERYNLPRGDFDRIQRQQAWMRAIMQKAMSGEVLTNPGKLLSMVNIMMDYSAVDQELNSTELVSLGLDIGKSGKPSFHMFTAPNDGTGQSDDGQSIVVLNRERLAEVSAAFKDGTIVQYLESHPDLDQVGDQPVA